jgi:hypothetical protein
MNEFFFSLDGFEDWISLAKPYFMPFHFGTNIFYLNCQNNSRLSVEECDLYSNQSGRFITVYVNDGDVSQS